MRPQTHTHTYYMHIYSHQGTLIEGEGSVQFTSFIWFRWSYDFDIKHIIFNKQCTLKRMSTVLSLPFQLVFPALTFLKYVSNTPFPHFCAIFSLSLLHTPDTSTRWLLTHPSMGVLRKDTPWRHLYRKDLSPK
jgi:hypothetical protein